MRLFYGMLKLRESPILSLKLVSHGYLDAATRQSKPCARPAHAINRKIAHAIAEIPYPERQANATEDLHDKTDLNASRMICSAASNSSSDVVSGGAMRKVETEGEKWSHRPNSFNLFVSALPSSTAGCLVLQSKSSIPTNKPRPRMSLMQ